MKKTKMTSLAITSSLVLSMFAATLPAMAEQYYSDVTEEHWAYSWVDYMHGKGYIQGYPDGTYRPDQPITRAEFVTILNSVLNSRNVANKDFADVTAEDWFYNQIQWAAGAGYFNGYEDGTAQPNRFITREEAAVIVSKAYQLKMSEENVSFTDEAEASEWALPYIKTLSHNSIIKGDENGAFRPKDNIFRAEVASMIAQAEQNPDLEQEKVVYPNSFAKTETGYTLNGLAAENIDTVMKLKVEAIENGNVGEYTVTAKIGDEVLVENSTLDELEAILAEKGLTADQLAMFNLSFGGFEGAEAGASLNVKLTVLCGETGKVFGTKNYTIAFGTASVEWPKVTGTKNNYQLTNIKAVAVADGKLVLTDKTTDEVGAYTVNAKIGSDDLGTFSSLEELAKALAEKSWADDSLNALTLTFKADGDKSFTLKFTVALTDAERNAIGTTAEYAVGFDKKTSSGGGGGLSGGSTRVTPLEERDRTVESLEDYQRGLNNSSSNRQVARDNTRHNVSNDMLKIILTNDGMTTFDANVVQSKDASKVDTAYEAMKATLKDTADHYAKLYPVYEDVIRYVIANNATLKGMSVTTANKSDIVLLFRAMVTTVNEAGNAACAVYNDSANAGKTAQERYDLFKTEATKAVSDALTACEGSLSAETKAEFDNIKTLATNYCLALFTSSEADSDLKSDLAGVTVGSMDIGKFVSFLTKYIPVR